MFLDLCLYSHTKENAKITAYIHDPERNLKNRIEYNKMIKYEEYFMDIDVPDNCNYYRDTKGLIPIITKI